MVMYVCAKLLQLSPTFCDFIDHRPPGSSVHGILQARIVEWVAMPFCRGSSQPKDRTHISGSESRPFTTEPLRSPLAI